MDKYGICVHMGESVAYHPLSILEKDGEDAFIEEVMSYEIPGELSFPSMNDAALEATIRNYEASSKQGYGRYLAKKLPDGAVVFASDMGITVYRKMAESK